MSKTELNGKPAVKLKAKMVIWANTKKAHKYQIGDTEQWIPDSLCNFIKDEHNGIGDIPGTLIIQEWFYNKMN